MSACALSCPGNCYHLYMVSGSITLMTIGPLTNVAVALKLDASFGHKLKNCVMMGGKYDGMLLCLSLNRLQFAFSSCGALLNISHQLCLQNCESFDTSVYQPDCMDCEHHYDIGDIGQY